MKKSIVPAVIACIAVLSTSAWAEDVIRYEGASQIYKAFIKNTADDFTRETGIRVTAKETSSKDAVPSLLAGTCNVAGLTRKMTQEELAKGKNLQQVLICYDHVAVFAAKDNPVKSLTMQQIRSVFSGSAASWKDLGGRDEAVKLLIPTSKTGLYGTFKATVLGGQPYAKTAVEVDPVSAILSRMDDRSISFMSYGIVLEDKRFRIIDIGKLNPGMKDYPISQEMYLVIASDAPEYVKKYISFFINGRGKDFLRKAHLASPYAM